MEFLLNTSTTDLNILIYNKDNNTLEDPFLVEYAIYKGTDVVKEKTPALREDVGLYYAELYIDPALFTEGQYNCRFYVTQQDGLEAEEYSNIYFNVVNNNETITDEPINRPEFTYITIEEVRQFAVNTLYEETVNKLTDIDIARYINFAETTFNSLNFIRVDDLKAFYEAGENIQFNTLIKHAVFENVVYLSENYGRIKQRLAIDEESIEDTATNGLNESYGALNRQRLLLGTRAYDLIKDFIPFGEAEVYFV